MASLAPAPGPRVSTDHWDEPAWPTWWPPSNHRTEMQLSTSIASRKLSHWFGVGPPGSVSAWGTGTAGEHDELLLEGHACRPASELLGSFNTTRITRAVGRGQVSANE